MKDKAIELAKQGLSQKEIADQLDRSPSTVSRWLKGIGPDARRKHDSLDEGLLLLAEQNRPSTIRGLYYQAVVHELVDKTEDAYTLVQRRLTLLRDSGRLPINWIVDGGRTVRRPYAVSSLSEELDNTAGGYRRRVWDTQPVQPVIVLEKLALVGIFQPITARWDVPLVVTQGFGSISLAAKVADIFDQATDEDGKQKPCLLLAFSDWDPSGSLMHESFASRIMEYADCQECIEFDRVALTPEQVQEWGLPSRPTKRKDNKHAKKFEGDSTELDAVSPPQLRNLIEDTVLGYLDPESYHTLQEEEDRERRSVEAVRDHWAEVQSFLRTLG